MILTNGDPVKYYNRLTLDKLAKLLLHKLQALQQMVQQATGAVDSPVLLDRLTAKRLPQE
jgi:hypothetical protein